MHFYLSGEIVSVNPWGNDTMVIYSKIESIKWNILDSIKKIGGFTCTKAIGKYKGRNYVAWFCPDIAVQSGPWKLQGLPGLILEAHDSNYEVVFTFSSFQNSNHQNLVSLPNNPKKITIEEYEKMKDALIQDPSGYISAMLNGQNSNSNGSNSNTNLQIQGPSSQSRKAKKINNPLELNE
jgi:GLPGLI family protein